MSPILDFQNMLSVISKHLPLEIILVALLQIVDEATQKSMIAWYHKKQEEQKELDENQDDSYMHSNWASGKSLKAHFSGVSEVKLPY
jgi:hypothetical protein